ncbi:MAG: hypothetical protein COW71_07240 [Ignavibacteriales bacterium CG18_big_fil_WC_8_21_14_2_50_31_20]|nr:MAG: hypothetical protein COW71_07240 [Ignavibacteriales bacterium CG18_big_fil_WC_8_21_14_2_50_31_20]
MLRYFYILFLFVFLSNSKAEEKIYPYKFDLDSTITGLVISEGHFFKNNNLSFVSIYNTFKFENKPPSILFFDQDYSFIEKLELTSPQSTIHRNILVFDFDGDSFDEIVFTITEPEKIWFLYYDPSNEPQIKTKIFEIPIKDNFDKINCSLTPAQIEGDNFFELIITISELIVRENIKRGIWAISVQNKSTIWQTYSAENLTKSDPINFVYGDTSYIIYSSAARITNRNKLYYSKGNYFHFDLFSGISSTFDTNFARNKNAILDKNSDDFSSDSLAILRAVDSNNKLLWKRSVGGFHTSAVLNKVQINGKEKLLLACTLSNKSFLEISDPKTGAIEKRRELDDDYNFYLYNDKIYATQPRSGIWVFDLDFNLIDSAKSKLKYSPFGSIDYENKQFVLLTEGPGILQSIVALDDELNKIAYLESQGATYFLPKTKVISAYDSGKRNSSLFRFKPVEWYNQISVDMLRNLVISFLIILLFTMVLWINTLRVSWKKIKKQKEELEFTNNELKETSNKLVQAEKLAVYGTIASSIAHEINSPLGAIINSAQRIKENKNANIENNINLIEKAGKRAKSIIEKLLIGSLSNNADVKTNLIDMLNEWKDLSIKQFENLGINLVTEISENPNLAISSTELNQIITNLLSNARDSIMDSGGEQKVISIKSYVLENNYTIVFSDTGSGFSSSKLEKPFEAFVSTKEKGKGTGLGLWVLKNILDSVRGEIKVKNSAIGAVVEIKIPLYIEKIGT